MSETKGYISASGIQDYWIQHIAPNYFNLESTNQYRSGTLGYINEVMSNVVMDGNNATNIARREFYPITAQYTQSLYKMGNVQKIGVPMVTPGTVKAILVIPQQEIINNSTQVGDVFKYVLDNSLKITADTIPFMLDYPIVILSKKSGSEWIHTIHYDTTFPNDLGDESSEHYIMNKVNIQQGTRYIFLAVKLRQVEMEPLSDMITTDTTISTATLLFNFDGDLSNFEVFYREDTNSETEIHLLKVMKNGGIRQTPFCYYELLNDNTIELSFPPNSYFTPKINSEIRLNVYTSKGKKGEFPVFTNPLDFSISSEKYEYNNNLDIIGITDGPCSGAKGKPTKEEYRTLLTNAYSTNKTITNENDLQIYFDSLETYGNSKVKFRKSRDDAMYRLYGAYILFKDSNLDVVPSNTLNLKLTIDDFDSYSDATKRGFIKPGTLFEYILLSDKSCIAKRSTKQMHDDLSIYDDNSAFYFTNPYLIAVSLEYGIAGMYSSAINIHTPIIYSYANDGNVIQFIGSNLYVKRNPMLGEDFYTFSMTLSPSTDLNASTIINTNPTEPLEIRATQDGKVLSKKYKNGHIYATIQYKDMTTMDILLGTYSEKTAQNTYQYHIGYTLKFDTLSTFVKGDLIAVRKAEDVGKIRIALDLVGELKDNELYIPMHIESYDEESDSYNIVGYLGTDDIINTNSTILIKNGIFNADGTENDNVSISMNQLQAEISIFYKNSDSNQSHKYSSYDYYQYYTLSNSYLEESAELDLIEDMSMIRSYVSYTENPSVTNGYNINLSAIPLFKANWIKAQSNFEYITSTVQSVYDNLLKSSVLLESGYTIDLKFFNTYGLSKYYTVGVSNSTVKLNYVNTSWKFGVHLLTLTPQSVFLDSFRAYVKEYIESSDSLTSMGSSKYIMNMISDLRNKFSEIGYMEYYGFNTYGYDAQKIEPVDESSLSGSELLKFVPEFVNIYSTVKDGIYTPRIDVTFI